jgi:hypothetical protein
MNFLLMEMGLSSDGNTIFYDGNGVKRSNVSIQPGDRAWFHDIFCFSSCGLIIRQIEKGEKIFLPVPFSALSPLK